RTRVEDTRELLENVQYAPARGRFKVYLIDEVHMLSTHSFNALLKTLEEPPPHVKFLLATTDPQKLPITVLSRCLQFHLKNLAPAQIVTYLQSVLAAELIEFEEDALWHLARAAAGSMRDALTLLDQSIAFGGGRVTVAAVNSLLGTSDFAVVFELLGRLSQRDAAGMIEVVRTASENNPDFARLLEQMLMVLHRAAIAQALPDAVDNSEGDREQVKQLAASLSAEDLQLYYQICLQTLQEMNIAPDRRVSFEMGLLRMFAFSPDVFMAQAAPDDQPLLADEKKKTEPASLTPAPLTPKAPPVPEEQKSPPPEVPVSVPVSEPAAATVPEQEPVTQPPAVEVETVVEVVATPEVPAQPVTPEPVAGDSDWYVLVQACELGGISGNILWNCDREAVEADTFRLVLDESQSALYSPDHQAAIAEALSAVTGRTVQVVIRIARPAQETPAARRRREKNEAVAAIHRQFNEDPFVVSLLETFDAKVEQDSLEIAR
ncbi:MAG TPA: DNA polymerase III subunit gamma/tau, partial [Pseudohongiella sp.]|nr:DNA polymerase III subunit gamma/tau [Pseudohongiella sp.]